MVSWYYCTLIIWHTVSLNSFPGFCVGLLRGASVRKASCPHCPGEEVHLRPQTPVGPPFYSCQSSLWGRDIADALKAC